MKYRVKNYQEREIDGVVVYPDLVGSNLLDQWYAYIYTRQKMYSRHSRPTPNANTSILDIIIFLVESSGKIRPRTSL